LTADHADHLSGTIEPALADGDLVISDRYSDSPVPPIRRRRSRRQRCRHRPPTRVYIKGIHAAFSRPPDATIYLDLDAREAAERAGRTNKFEQDGYLAAVRKTTSD